MKKPFWKRGQRAALARYAKIDPSNIYAILARRRGVGSYAMALTLEKASKRVLDKPIPAVHWYTNRTTKHPAFKTLAKRRKK